MQKKPEKTDEPILKFLVTNGQTDRGRTGITKFIGHFR